MTRRSPDARRPAAGEIATYEWTLLFKSDYSNDQLRLQFENGVLVRLVRKRQHGGSWL